MIKRKTLLVVLSIYLCCPSGSDAVGSFMSTPESTNGVLTSCPGDRISITCTHNITSSALTQWRLPGVDSCLIAHGLPAPQCLPFTVTMVSDGSGPMLNSTVAIIATEGLSGEVECLSGLNIASLSVLASVDISVAAISTPKITLIEQISQSMVQVNMSVDNTQCAATYVVNATQDGGSGSMSGGLSSTSPVTVNGLDVCRYSYSFVGYVITASNNPGDMSAPFRFIADLSGLNGISDVLTNSPRTVLQWDQMTNPDYPDCIISYSIGYNGMTYNTADTATSVTREILIGFPFCITTSVTVTPVTPMGLLDRRDSTANVSLVSPDFVTPSIFGGFTLNISVVGDMNETNVAVSNMIVFSGIVQGISQIINPRRMIGYSRAGMTCTSNTVFTDDSFKIALPNDAEFGEEFTMCVQLTFGDCMEMTSRNFTIPGRTITSQKVGTVSDTSFTVTVNLPITEYPPDQLLVIVSPTPNDTPPVVANFPANYQYTVMFSSLMPGTSYTYTVRVVRLSDMTGVVEPFVADFLIAAIPTTMAPTPPPTTSPITTSEQTTSSPGTPSTQGGGCTGSCIAGIIVGFLIVLVLVVVIIVVVLCYWNKTKKSREMKHQMELQSTKVKLNTNDGEDVDPMANIPVSPPTSGTLKGPVYEDPDAFKVDPHTQDNLAYGHVQQSAQLKGPIYEDIKPDPHTQENLAYGHVQFN